MNEKHKLILIVRNVQLKKISFGKFSIIRRLFIERDKMSLQMRSQPLLLIFQILGMVHKLFP